MPRGCRTLSLRTPRGRLLRNARHYTQRPNGLATKRARGPARLRAMPRVVEVASFVAQSVAIGLALAFAAVLVRPELINRAATSANHTSYADAVAATAPAVVNIYTERVYSVPRAPRGLTVR